MQQQEKICEYCGVTFIPERSSRKYCSPTCNQYAYLKRKEESVVQETTTVQKVYKIPEPENAPPENKQENTVQTESTKPVSVEKLQEKNEVKEKLPSNNNQTAVNQQSKPLTYDEKLQKRIKDETFLWNFALSMNKWSGAQLESAWQINEHIRNAIENLLSMAERDWIYLSELKNLKKFLDELRESSDFKNLHNNYPHRKFPERISEKLGGAIALQEAQFITRFRLDPSEDLMAHLLGTLYVIKQQQKKFAEK